MNGVTGRMGLNQHLRRSIYALIEQGGVRISDDEAIMPRPLLVGRNASKLEAFPASSAGFRIQPIWTRRWQTHNTQSTSTRRLPPRAPMQFAKQSRQASTSIAKSRLRARPKQLWNSIGSP